MPGPTPARRAISSSGTESASAANAALATLSSRSLLRRASDRSGLRARLRAGAASRRYRRLGNVVIHETADPDVVIVEYELHGEFSQTAEPFSMRFLMVLTVRDGQIVHSRDYSNPIVGAQVIGRLPELIAALSAGGTAINS